MKFDNIELDSLDNGYVTRSFDSRSGELEKSDDWIVTGVEQVENKTILAKGNIIINNGGVLTLKGVELKMDTTENPLLINVTNGGTLEIYDSSVSISTTMKVEHYSYTFKIYGNAIIDNCDITYVGHVTENFTKDPDVSSCGTNLPTYELPWDGFGIEIYDDNVTISNSKISYSNSGLTCFEASPKIVNNTVSTNLYGIIGIDATLNLINNEISNNSIGVFCNNTELTVLNGRVLDNQYGISVSYSNLVVNSTLIYRNYEGIFGWGSSILCENTQVYQNEIYGIYFEESNLTTDNSSIFSNYYGIYSTYSRLQIEDSELNNNWVGIKADNCVGELNNNIFTSHYFQGIDTYRTEFTIYNCTILGHPTENSDYSADNIGVMGVLSNFTIYECTIKYNRVGIDDGYSSNIKIYDNLITGNYNGIFNFLAEEFEVYNNTIVDNYAGIYSWDSNLNIYNNLITANIFGIVYKQTASDNLDLEISIKNNIIANNADWGMYVFNHEADISDNTFVDDSGKPNGQGKILQEFPFTIYVDDLYDEPITLVKIEIQDILGNTVASGMTNTNGELEVYNLTYYKLLNDNSEIYYNPHEVTVKWGDDDWGYVIDRATVEISEVSNITFKLSLPDVFISDDDLKISKTRPHSGDNVNIEATVHYTGGIPASDLTVVFTENGAIIEEVKIDTIADGETKKVSIKWKVYSPSDATINLRVRVDTPSGFEYHRTVYRKNNNASHEISVKGEDEPFRGIVLTGEECIAISPFVGIIFIVILILIFAIIRKRRKARKEQQKVDEKEEEKPGAPKRPEFRRPPQQPGRGRPPSVRPPRKPPAKPESGREGIPRVQNPWK